VTQYSSARVDSTIDFGACVCGYSELNMLPSPIQLAGQDMIKKTLGAAVKEGTIANETLAYFIGRTALFLLKAGIKMEHLRFRCNLI
jgi:glycyl-tRNA synthetase (class II)